MINFLKNLFKNPNIIINIAKDFSPNPAGRTLKDGPNSAERFREEFLVPHINDKKIRVELDGVEGYASSFLEEAFGGLIRINNIPITVIYKNLKIAYRHPVYEAYQRRIWNYIHIAEGILPI